MEKKAKPFRFNARVVLLTYVSHFTVDNVPAEFSKEALQHHLTTEFPDISYLIIGREYAPGTGAVHFHAYAEFRRK